MAKYHKMYAMTPRARGSFGNAWGGDKEGTTAAATIPWGLQLCTKVTLPGYLQAEQQHLPQHCVATKFMRTQVLEKYLNCSQVSLNSDHLLFLYVHLMDQLCRVHIFITLAYFY